MARHIVYTICVDYSWDPGKSVSNLAKHGLSFEVVRKFTWPTALVLADIRVSYPEPRLAALGLIGGRLHFLVYSIERRTIRVISLRRASNKEQARYETKS